jgi:SAM-dependent methyltransferase
MNPSCLGCGAPLHRTVVDLGSTPLANSYVAADRVDEPEATYPLHVRVCDECLLVQVEDTVPREALFSDYAYFSSFSDSWLRHAAAFVDSAVERLGLGPDSHVIEVASNDGYLLRNVVDRGIPCLGIEPAANIAEASRALGIETLVEFFGTDLARELAASGRGADLVVANNVLAHNADINGFVGGLRAVLRPGGVVSIEAPHLLRLLESVQFDTIYHEHFFYFSLHALQRAFARHDLRVFDVEELTTHGGSLRVWACATDDARTTEPSVDRVLADERTAQLQVPAGYAGFADRVERCRASLRAFLHDAAAEGRRVVAYGAAAKGNTLLNVCGVTRADIEYVVDRSPHKQGRHLPGSLLPVRSPDAVFEDHPDELLLLAWNLQTEIMDAMAGIRDWGGRFVTPVPEVEVHA